MVHCGTTIAQQEGVGALYKGLTPFVTHLTLKYALRFGSYAFFQSSIGGSTSSTAPRTKSDSLKPFLVRGRSWVCDVVGWARHSFAVCLVRRGRKGILVMPAHWSAAMPRFPTSCVRSQGCQRD